jgi:hypothetical protein
MKRLVTSWTALAACVLTTSAFAEPSHWDTARRQMTTSGSLANYFDDVAPEAPVAGEQGAVATDEADVAYSESEYGCAEEAACGCEASCECGEEASCECGDGCGGACDSGWDLGNCFTDCCIGDAWLLQSYLQPCCDKTYTYAGWFSVGYYNHNERLSRDEGDALSFNDVPHELGLDQAWFYTEKVADADACSADWGYRFDAMYGRHGHTAQAYGNDGGTWDVTFDHGYYEWALPQLYAEVAFGDWSWKLGKWFTPVGYEVIPSNGNFFYSHSLTHYNSEPFSHTGALGTYSGIENNTLYAGWALGWDTGFDQYDGGNIFIGGLTHKASEDVSLTYLVTTGNFGWKSEGEFGFSHHFVGIFDLTENWQYVLQHDYLTTDGIPGDDDTDGEDKGVTNYLFYTFNDCWKVGGRAEWWKSDNVIPGEDASFYEIAAGVNYQVTANLVIRPEIRYDWTPSDEAYDDAFDVDYNQEWFGIDAVVTY